MMKRAALIPGLILLLSGGMAAASETVESASGSLTISLNEGVSLELIRVPAGSFVMGATDGEGPARGMHRVEITRPFYLGRFETTQEQWEAVMGSNPSRFKNPHRPVESVSWLEIQEFLEKLTETAGAPPFRLPTEAEWEYACRAGTTTHFSFGNEESLLGEYGWYEENSDQMTHPVGEKKPSPWGFHDMHGNVAEVCSDWYAPYDRRFQTDPTGPKGGQLKVFRGGRWFYAPSKCRSDRRSNCPINYRNQGLGFRIARDAE